LDSSEFRIDVGKEMQLILPALSLRGAKRRGNLESGLPRYARSDKRNIF